ncbi:hypothetical protein [Sphingomonas sp. S2-65]|uniref:hypothetical protein n=1 Tax=Sphingomonas sp. S2-65 TaxID=2903960 RepID=UPI001F2158AA|nr:hypothetical protein [Sphingomonas sp. S2-65]UYY57659.1 hypothetical protein LZ586_13460 [Sphingomonas sp. S2-65]
MNHIGLVAQMHQHHRAIADYTAEADALVRAAELDPATVSNARWRFVRVLTAYQVFKHQQIFDPIMQNGSQLDADAARQLKAECIITTEAFRSYIAKWSTSGIVGREDEYRCEAQAMILRVRTHIARERRGVEALFARGTRAA